MRHAIALLLLLPVPAGALAPLFQEVKTVTIRPLGDTLEFDLKEITAPAGSRLRVVLENTATLAAMSHNFALLNVPVTDEATIQAVGMAALQAGEPKGYLADHDAVLAQSRLAAPGQTVEVEFTVPPPGEYGYICTYLGHWVTMKGVLRSTP